MKPYLIMELLRMEILEDSIINDPKWIGWN